MYRHPCTVRLADTDAAGVIYFAFAFRIAHEAFEAFLQARGWGVDRLLREGPCRLPVVRAEADYLRPAGVGDELVAELTLGRLGRSSVQLRCTLKRPGGPQIARVNTVHAALNPATGRTMPLPPALRQALRALRQGET